MLRFLVACSKLRIQATAPLILFLRQRASQSRSVQWNGGGSHAQRATGSPGKAPGAPVTLSVRSVQIFATRGCSPDHFVLQKETARRRSQEPPTRLTHPALIGEQAMLRFLV